MACPQTVGEIHLWSVRAVPLLTGAASEPWPPSHAGTGDALHSFIPKTVNIGVCSPPHLMWDSVLQGPGGSRSPRATFSGILHFEGKGEVYKCKGAVGRAVLLEEKKRSCSQVSQKCSRPHHVGSGRVAVGGWRLAVGGGWWQWVVVGGGWWLGIGG